MHGVYLILAGAGLALFGWLIPRLLLEVAQSDLIDPGEVPRFAQRLLEHRRWIPVLALPTVMFGVLATLKVRRRWLWVALGLASMLVPAGLLIYSFVAWVGRLYGMGRGKWEEGREVTE